MKNLFRAMRAFARAAAVLLALIGPAAAINIGGAAMQIDVEVYKGPLSKEPIIQYHELLGLTTASKASARGLFAAMAAHGAQAGYCDTRGMDAGGGSQLQARLDSLGDSMQRRGAYAGAHGGEALRLTREFHDVCNRTLNHAYSQAWLESMAMLAGMYEQLSRLESQSTGAFLGFDAARENIFAVQHATPPRCRVIAPSDPPADFKEPPLRAITQDCLELQTVHDARGAIQQSLASAAEVGQLLEGLAFYRANAQLAVPIKDDVLRTLVASSQNLAAEVANQLTSRSDALLKQMGGDDAHLLPLSIYLRDAGPTAFLQNYVWQKAGMTNAGLFAPGRASGNEMRERAGVIDRLFADHSWRRINRVYASGAGDVRMAFIKDDIGNWSLKSFDSNPEALVKSFADVGRAMAGAAAKIALGKVPPGKVNIGAANQAYALAERAAFGMTPQQAAASDRTVVALHNRVVAQLKQMKETVAGPAAAAQAQIATAQGVVTTAAAALTAAQLASNFTALPEASTWTVGAWTSADTAARAALVPPPTDPAALAAAQKRVADIQAVKQPVITADAARLADTQAKATLQTKRDAATALTEEVKTKAAVLLASHRETLDVLEGAQAVAIP